MLPSSALFTVPSFPFKMFNGPYSQHFILFVTSEFAQQARVLHYNALEMLVRDKHSSLLVPALTKICTDNFHHLANPIKLFGVIHTNIGVDALIFV
jgi:hypothetical protein